jgi:hypothetical protein
VGYLTKDEFNMLSRAVVLWHRFYEVSPVTYNSAILCRAAIDLLSGGFTTAEAISAQLIETYGPDDLPERDAIQSYSVASVVAKRH